MAENLNVLRIKSKLDEVFEDKIDLEDAKSAEEKENKYYTRAIAALALMMQCGINPDLAVQGITDGFHDIGLDAIYNDAAQKKLVLVQSKWRKEGNKGISQNEASTFVEGVKRIINLDFQGCNEKIIKKQQEISSAIKDMDYQIEMVFCHTGSQKANEYAMRSITELLHNVNEDDSMELLSFKEIKLQEVYEYLARGQNASITLEDVLLKNWGMIDVPVKAYYGIIPASAVGEWYCRYGNRLFAKNIRYYKGSTEVNLGMKNVLKTEPENFFYYNNGLKLLCNRITKKAAYSTGRDVGLFSLEGVSLVNGAQTTGVIGSVFNESPEVLREAVVFVQMIDLGENSEEKATQITKLSNTQNRIDGKDFASLDLNQERLWRELSLSGIQYLYKAGDKIEDPEKQISLEETIVVQACLLSDLSIIALSKRNIGALTENIEKTPYKLLFNDSTNSFTMYNGVLVLRSVELQIMEREPKSSGRKRLVLVHGNRFMLHLVLNQLKKMEGFNSQRLTQEQILEQVKLIFDDLWDKIYHSMEMNFPEAYPAYIFKNVGRLKELELT